MAFNEIPSKVENRLLESFTLSAKNTKGETKISSIFCEIHRLKLKTERNGISLSFNGKISKDSCFKKS